MIARKKHRHVAYETLETRELLSSQGWDGPGQGSADLNYYVGDAPGYLDESQVELAIETALDAWADVIDVEFTQTSTPHLPDSIDFEFAQIDGPNGTLAQAYFPDDVNRSRIAGDVQFDSSETWEIGNGRGGSAIDLTLVAVHEIGHSLGLDHIALPTAVMHASVSAYSSFQALSTADIDAALALYAPAPPPTTAETPIVSIAPPDDPSPDVATTETDKPDTTNNSPNWWISWKSFRAPWGRPPLFHHSYLFVFSQRWTSGFSQRWLRS